MKIKNASLSSKKGQVYLYIAFIGIIILALGLGWIYLRDQEVFGGLNLPFIDLLQPKVTVDTKDWKEFKVADGLVILYPPNWLVTEDKYISQYPYTPGKVSDDVYNAISAAPIIFQLQTSYANEDWFSGIYNAKKDEIVLNQYHVNDQNAGKYKKIESGKTLQGERFVLYQDLKTPGQINAYLMVQRTHLYQFTLDHYDQPGTELFKQILTTARPI